MTQRLETLMVLKTLLSYNTCTAKTLETMGGVSPATLKRYIADLRVMGAEIVSVRMGGTPAYECLNGQDCKARLDMWIELETENCLVAGSKSKFGHRPL